MFAPSHDVNATCPVQRYSPAGHAWASVYTTLASLPFCSLISHPSHTEPLSRATPRLLASGLSHAEPVTAIPVCPGGGKQLVRRCQCEQPSHVCVVAESQLARRPSILVEPLYTWVMVEGGG